jgi:hypothetical protein
MEKAVKNRTTLESQLKENEGVAQEFKLLEKDDSTIFKLIGPVLVKQDRFEGSSYSELKPLRMLRNELNLLMAKCKLNDLPNSVCSSNHSKRSETLISDLQGKVEKKKMEVSFND